MKKLVNSSEQDIFIDYLNGIERTRAILTPPVTEFITLTLAKPELLYLRLASRQLFKSRLNKVLVKSQGSMDAEPLHHDK